MLGLLLGLIWWQGWNCIILWSRVFTRWTLKCLSPFSLPSPVRPVVDTAEQYFHHFRDLCKLLFSFWLIFYGFNIPPSCPSLCDIVLLHQNPADINDLFLTVKINWCNVVTILQITLLHKYCIYMILISLFLISLHLPESLWLYKQNLAKTHSKESYFHVGMWQVVCCRTACHVSTQT